MQKWEIAGISMLPVVELALVLNTALGHDGAPLVDPTIILHAFAAVATLAALVRAGLAKKAAG